jgi:hypothetical protein
VGFIGVMGAFKTVVHEQKKTKEKKTKSKPENTSTTHCRQNK